MSKKKNHSTFQPRNQAQADYQNAIQTHDLTFGIGPAGVGKTHIAATEAATAFEAGEVARIILIRPAREAAGERLGYLPGTAEQKVEPYLFPIFDSWKDLWSDTKIKSMIDQDQIQSWPIAHLRGRTFRNSFVIVDEIQNLTLQQLYLVLTRFGEGSRMVLDGDFNQSDLSKYEVPCRPLVEKLTGSHSIAHCYFNESDVVRHPIVKRVIEAMNEIVV